MEIVVKLKKVLTVILSISLAGLLFAGLGCEKEGGFDTLPEITMEGGEEAVEEEVVPEETIDVEGEGEAVPDKIAPNVSKIIPVNRSTISKSERIIIKFENSMATDACSLGGLMAAKSDGGTWSDQEAQNDTLTIKPETSWPIGTGTLKVSCIDKDGNVLPASELTYGIQTVYVRQNENGPGTLDKAMGDINKAITYADQTWRTPSQVHVAEGLYQVESGSTHIVLKEGISLYGGFLGSNWKLRSPSKYITLIEDTNIKASETSYDNAAVLAGSGITNNTVIDGFFIKGGGTEHSAAIRALDGAAPIISNNNLDGGKGKGTSAGVRNHKSSPKIIKNTIYGGSGASVSSGIGNSDHSSPLIYNNVISAGELGDYGYGIDNSMGSSPEIINNTIIDCKGKVLDVAILNGTYSHPRIINNIIVGSGYAKGICVYDDANSNSEEFANNCISVCVYKHHGVGYFTSLDVNSEVPHAHDNIKANPGFVDKSGGNFHLKDTAPIEVREGGQNLSDLFKDDRNGNLRKAPWSIGAYQWPTIIYMKKAILKKKKY